MKKKNTVEKNVRKQALKFTAIFVALNVVIDPVIFAIISFIAKHFGILVFNEVPVRIRVIVFFVIIFAILGYLDFKKEIIKCQKNDNDNEKTK